MRTGASSIPACATSRRTSVWAASWPWSWRPAACLAVMGYLVLAFFWSEAAAQAERKKSPYPMAPALSEEPPWTPSPGGPYATAAGSSSTACTAGRERRRVPAAGRQGKALHSYGPSGEKGFVHIPIQQAIKAVAGTLPVAKEPSQGRVDANGLLDGGARIPAACFEDHRHENRSCTQGSPRARLDRYCLRGRGPLFVSVQYASPAALVVPNAAGADPQAGRFAPTWVSTSGSTSRFPWT